MEYRPAAEEPDYEFPLYLTTGRIVSQYQSGTQTRRIPALMQASPEPFVEIHPSMARTYGIQDGDEVRLTTRRGTALLAARLTPEIRMDTLFVPFHFNGSGRANLLTNAAKYTEPGGRITLTVENEHGEVRLSVSDTGIGLLPEMLPRVFDLFVQGDRAPDRAQGGLGVGLAVVKRLVEMHQGSVSARSDGPGRGATFEIRLPLIERRAAPAGKPAVRQAPSAARILVVDDNRDAADSLGALLALEGHTVERAYSAADALRRAVPFQAQVVLLDIGLPEIDGYEVARRLRLLPELRDTRLIAVTGYGQPRDRERARAAGFDEHLIKPVSTASVARVLSGTPRGSAMR